ncbi:hypothetical protein N7509_006083 [Penicillium cosmopolitanum]|uniref:Uncharacterized protein n=1 Tax=Penicillium cosmopolitanum TaxID=1131564 RepID=A0A9W9W3I4_9EURO|nr:uncharacterized protein N7509_006083 [Penicillium cosmopolitanum]KAJ5397970.1 hypothetical protein N7509_006083 [Penicillium cosmopolitanum]
MVSLNRKVAELRAKYSGINEPSPLLTRVLDDDTKSSALYYVVNRQVQHICCHSSSWDDGEVTIYDTALVRMYEEGLPLQNIGLLELFFAEYMGLGLCSSAEEEEATVNAFLAAAHPITHNATTDTESPYIYQSQNDRESCDTIYQEDKQEDKQGDNVGRRSEMSNKDSSKDTSKDMRSPKSECELKDGKKPSPRKEALLENLVQVYHTAKADYYLGDADKSGISSKKTDKFSNVRFLRDSSENLLRYMRSEGYDNHPLVSEVENVADASREHAEHLAGCKRNYEQREGSNHAHSRWSHKRRRWNRGVDSYRPGN